MTKDELDWLREKASISKTTVEIGIFMGRSTYALCQGGNRVIGIDTFNGTGKKDIDNILYPFDSEAEARKNLAEFLDKNLVLIKGNSSDISIVNEVKRLAGGVIDFLFIDGDHDLTEVIKDIVSYEPMIRPGGIISGHDFHLPGVSEAVKKLIPNHQLFSDIWFRQIPEW